MTSLAFILEPAGIVVSVIWLVPISLAVRRYLHILQLEEYSNRRLLRWAASKRADRSRIWRWPGIAIALLLIAASILSLGTVSFVVIALWLLLAAAMAHGLWPRPAKKPLVFTARVRRLLAATGIVTLAVVAPSIAIARSAFRSPTSATPALTVAVLTVAFLLLLDVGIVALANLGARPVEAFLRRRYRAQAYRRVRLLAPKIIGITGSYGKTTTKELLASVLASRFPTVRTPESWNTLMGLTRAIRERLSERDEIFVVEMGAYKRGEIAELCALTGPPAIGILTGINEQHLERFGGIENTMRAKYELIDAVQPGGLAIFNADNLRCRSLADKTTHVRVVRVGLDAENGPLDYTATAISVSRDGTRFTCVANGQEVPFRTRLLGEHFVLNILAATAAAEACGMTIQQVAAAVAAIPPVPHRLQLVPSSTGVTTIDDAYSANPDGARAALHVLGQMEGGQRILVTPGFVELGEKEEELNRNLGGLANSACDILVLVGRRRTAPIREGALAAGMDLSRIEVVESVAAARSFLQGIARSGDTILFENDLPDNYDE